jgi:hypothetical protein
MGLVFLAGFLPWSLMLPFAIARLGRIERIRNPRLLYLVTWFAVVMLFYSFAFSKRGVYLLALYPSIAAIVGLYLAEELAAPKPPRWIRPMSFGMGVFFALAGIGGLAAATIIRLWPGLAHWPLAQFGVTAPAFVPQLSAAIGAQRLLVVMLAAVMIAAGYVLTRAAAGVARFATATAVGFTCLSIVANLYVLPATANTLALKEFAIEVAKTVGKDHAAYLFGLNYDIAFYSGKTFPVVAITPKDWPEYLILGEDTYQALAAREMRDYTPVLKSGAIYLDGTGQMLLARRKGS